MGKYSLLQTFPLASGAWGSWRLGLPVKTKAKKALSTLTFLCHEDPYSIQKWAYIPSGYIFILLLINLLKLFLLLFIYLTRFNSRWICLSHCCMLRLFLYSSWVMCSCFHLLYDFLLCLSFVKIFLFVHAGLLQTAFAWFPAHEDDPFLSLAEAILENQPALLDCSSLRDIITQDFSKQMSEEAKTCSPEVQGFDPAVLHCVNLLCTLISPLRKKTNLEQRVGGSHAGYWISICYQTSIFFFFGQICLS